MLEPIQFQQTNYLNEFNQTDIDLNTLKTRLYFILAALCSFAFYYFMTGIDASNHDFVIGRALITFLGLLFFALTFTPLVPVRLYRPLVIFLSICYLVQYLYLLHLNHWSLFHRWSYFVLAAILCSVALRWRDYVINASVAIIAPILLGFFSPLTTFELVHFHLANVTTFLVIGLSVRSHFHYKKQVANLTSMIIDKSKMVALGQMASGLAHEVNNPLAVINGSILVLEKKIQDGVTDKNALVNLINKIERMSKRIEYIVKSFQQFSRRRPVEELEITTVEEVTMGIRHFVVDKEQTTKVRFDLDYEQSLAIPFRCFKSQVLLATNHLIQNAVQACNGLSEPIVKIKIQATGQHFTFTIQDNGPGVPEHLTSKIMEPFFTTRVIGEGAGLGLSIVLGIAQQHHGELYLDRAQSNSCFVFRVPLIPN